MSTSGKMCMFKQPCQYNRITQASTLLSPVTHVNTHDLQIIFSPMTDSQSCLLMEVRMIVSSSVLSFCFLSESDFCVVLWGYTWNFTFNQTHPQLTSYNTQYFTAVWLWYLIQSHVKQQSLNHHPPKNLCKHAHKKVFWLISYNLINNRRFSVRRDITKTWKINHFSQIMKGWFLSLK